MRRGALAIWADKSRDALLGMEPPCALWRELSGGLVVVLERKDETQWRLGLGRRDVQPSAQEIAICRATFGVQTGTELTYRKQDRKSPVGQVLHYHIAELFWREHEFGEGVGTGAVALVAGGAGHGEQPVPG